TEEAYLNSEKGQVYIASAIYRAFKEYKIEMDTKGYQKSIVSKPSSSNSQSSHNEVSSKNLPIFRIQLASSPVDINTDAGRWKKVSNLIKTQENRVFKYMQGSYNSLSKAVSQQRYWRSHGFSDAFVVAYYQGKRISLQRAKELSSK
ncbi:MAG: hypothetical protein MK212_16910, partial [Saprospiraceae bacterium]|nr:hypothetical protein [Saprospiraceae bacterium]